MSSSPQLSHFLQLFSQRPLAVLLIVAAVLRIGVVWCKFENLSTDTDSYLAIAKNLQQGEGFCSVPGRPTAFRPPLYPLLVCLCTGFAGTVGLALAQITLGTVTCGLAWLFATRLQLSDRARLLTALIVTLDPLLLLYTSHAMTETLATFLVTSLLVVLAGDRSTGRSILIGVLFGLVVLCRPSLWAFGGLSAGLFLIRVVRAGTNDTSRSEMIRHGLVTVVAVLVTVGPWVVRNTLVFGRPIVMTTHGGYTLLLANNPVFYEEVVSRGQIWTAASLEAWQAQVDRTLSVDGISETDESGRDSAMREMAMGNIRRQPGQFARSCMARVLRFWSPVPQSKPKEFGLPARYAVLTWYLTVFCLLVVGLVRIHVIGENVVPAVLLIVSLMIVHSIFWSNSRMRAPVTVAVGAIAATVVFPQKTKIKRTLESTAHSEL